MTGPPVSCRDMYVLAIVWAETNSSSACEPDAQVVGS